MLLDKTSLDRQLLYLGTIPAFIVSVVALVLIIYLHHDLRTEQETNQYDFIASLFNNMDVENEENFQVTANALLLSESYFTIALFDANYRQITYKGVPLDFNFPSAFDERNLWVSGDKRFSAVPITLNKPSGIEPGWVLVSSSNLNKSVWLYQATLLVIITILVSTLVFNRMLRSLRQNLLFSAQDAESGLRQLMKKNYGFLIDERRSKIYRPLARLVNNLSRELKASNEELQETIDLSITELRETLETVEIQNIEIDLARKNAVKAVHAKSEFLANTSHEIRTPINGIIGFANLLRKSSLNNKQSEYVETILESAQVLLLNINDIIDYSRLEIGKLNLDYKPVHIKSIIEDSNSFIEAKHQGDALSFITDIHVQAMENLLGDPLRIKQVYSNLLINCIEYCKGTEIKSTVTVDEHEDSQITIKIAITANGNYQGNPSLIEAQQVLSAQASDTLTDSKNQMGLILAKGLVTRMQGHIGISINENDAAFWFTVALGRPVNNESQASSIPEEQPRVLVVDDNPSNRKLVSELLKDFSVDVECAESGQKALDYCENSHYSLILMDIQMPGMDGFETTQKLRERETSGSRVPIIALTAHAVEDEKALLLKSGMDDFISKPIGETELHELLRRWTKYSPSQEIESDSNSTLDSQQPNSVTKTQIATTASAPVEISSCIKLAKGKHDLAHDMLKGLLDSLPKDIESMSKLWEKQELKELQEIVHRVHGGACYSGVPRLLESSAALDKSLINGNSDAYQNQYEALISSAKELIEWEEEHDLDVLFSPV